MFDPRLVHGPCEICGGQCGAGIRVSPVTVFFPRWYHSTNSAFSSDINTAFLQKDKRAIPGAFEQSTDQFLVLIAVLLKI